MRVNRWIAILLLMALIATVIFGFLPLWTANAESPSIHRMIRYEGFLAESDFPNNVIPVDVLRVDIDPMQIDENGDYKAIIHMLFVADGLTHVILTDGTHICSAAWEQEEDTLILTFHGYDILRLDGTKGLWLITIQELR